MAASPRKKAEKQAPVNQMANEQPPRARSLVFVSHDSRDSALAESFSNLLSDVSGGILKSFRSSDKRGTSGIEFGAEWYAEIMSKIDDASDVVALLTPNSVDRPWILYEAGVAKGKLDATVFGVALGVPLEKVSTGPFGQFQNCDGDEDSLTKLVMQLLKRNPDAAPREEAVRVQVKSFRERVTEVLSTSNASADDGQDDDNAARLFEEVKAMVRELPERMDARVRSASRSTILRRLARRSSGMVEELVMASRYASGPTPPASDTWLILVSLLRDDLPWLYEKGLAIYRAVQNGIPIDKAVDEFVKMTHYTLGSPLSETILDKEVRFAFRHIPDMAQQLGHELHGEQQANAAKRPKVRSVL